MTLWKVITPEATTNLVTNPSFETNTTGWTTGGTNTIARSDDQQWAGNYSLEVTYGNNSVLARHAVTLSTNTTYRLTARARPASNWDGGDIEFAINGLTSATLTNVRKWTDGTDETGTWTLLEAELVITSDGAGNIDIVTDSAPTAGRLVHIDAVQIEAKSGYATTYCDGDQAGCVWTDKPHGSTSTRPATTRAGGKVLDLDSDLGFVVDDTTGAGVTRVNLITSNRSLLPGEEYQRTSVRSRLMTLAGHIVGTSRANYHSQRQALLRYFMPDSVPDNQPAVLQYEGAGDVKRLPVHYIGGMEIRGPQVFAEKFGIQLQATEPFWEGEGEAAVNLGSTSATMRLIVGRVGGEWTVFGPPHASGTYTSLNAIAVASPNEVYAGGSFANFDNDALSDNLVMWDGDSWEPVDSGITPPNGKINALVLDPAGNLYIGGAFTGLGVAGGDYIVRWTGSGWEAIGTPGAGATATAVNAVAIHPLTGHIYVGGDFLNLAGVANADYIAYWDGSDWNALGTGMNGAVNALAFTSDGMLWAGGAFTTAGGNTANRIARWSGSGWGTVGGGVNNTVNTIAISSNGRLYIGGAFTQTTGGNTLNYTAQLLGISWQPLGHAMDAAVHALHAAGNGLLYAIGQFTEAGGNSLSDGIATWDGGAWTPMSIDLPGVVSEGAIASYGDDLYFGTNQEGTVYLPGTVTATNAGTARAYPIIEIANEGTDVVIVESVSNLTTGKRLMFRPNTALLPDQQLVIDLRPGRVRAFDPKRGERVPWPLAPGSDVAEFYLLPGENELAAYSSPEAPADLNIHVRWTPTYWSID